MQHSSVTLLRLCGLRNSSAILATLKVLINIDNDIHVYTLNLRSATGRRLVACKRLPVVELKPDVIVFLQYG